MEKQKNQKPIKKEKQKKRSSLNREFSIVTYFFLILFLALIAYVSFFQIVKAEKVINNTYNKRQSLFAKTVTRGSILSSDGEVLAETVVDSDGNETRRYPYKNVFAHAVGYSTNGTTGVESLSNFELLRSHTSVFNQVYNMLSGEKNPGDTVVTTFDAKLQQVAYDALGSNDGAVIAMDPKTGKIIAMVSKPDFDPNRILTDYEELIGESQNGENNSVLLNRATQGSYTPGSVFKIFTTLEYIRENKNFNNFSYECDGKETSGDHVIHCFNGESHASVNLEQAFAKSCNCAYASIGLSLDMDSFSENCKRLLFNSNLPTAYPFTKSSFTLNGQSETWSVMQGSIGQDTITISPLHILLVTSAIANNGVLMKPYSVDYTMNDAGIHVTDYPPEKYGNLMTEAEAEVLQTYMEACVSYGTGTKLKSDIYTAAGKTGSAQISDTSDDTHSWFTGYATDKDGNQLAIAVIVEKKGNGSRYAVPIAKKVFDSYFQD